MFKFRINILYLLFIINIGKVNCKNKNIDDYVKEIADYKNPTFLNKVKSLKNLFSDDLWLYTISNTEDFLLTYGRNRGERTFDMLSDIWEEALIESTIKIFFQITDELLNYFDIGVEINEVYKKIDKKNYKVKKLLLTDEENQEFNKIITLFNLSLNQVYNNSVVYIHGPAGVGKTSNVINELIKNGFIVLYINASNIIYGPYNEVNVSNVLWNIWKKALNLKKNNKVIIVFDECESLIKGRNKNILNDNNVENILINTRKNIEKALTVFFLYILTQRSVSILLISNPSYDKEGNLDLDGAMHRRINYIYDMQLPSIKNLIELWKFYLTQYKITILDDDLEKIIYYLSEVSYKNKVSIRTISTLTSAFRNKKIYLKNLLPYLIINSSKN